MYSFVMCFKRIRENKLSQKFCNTFCNVVEKRKIMYNL